MSVENARRILQQDPQRHLFRPLTLRSISMRNRIVMLPMCQYSATDWVPGGWDVDEAIVLCRQLKQRGDVDLIDCITGGNDPAQRIPAHPGYQVPFAERNRREADIPTGAVGLISTPETVEEIVANGRADLMMGRMLLFNPYWLLHAANALKAKTRAWPVQYERSNIF